MQGTASTAHPSVPMGDLFFSDCRLFWYFHTPLPPHQADNGALIAHWQRLPGFGELLPPPLRCFHALQHSHAVSHRAARRPRGGGGQRHSFQRPSPQLCVCLPSAAHRLYVRALPPSMGDLSDPRLTPLLLTGEGIQSIPFFFLPPHPDAQTRGCSAVAPRSPQPQPTHPPPPGKEGMWALMWGIQVSTNPDPSPLLPRRAALCSHPIFHPTLQALPFTYSCACSCSPCAGGVGLGRRGSQSMGVFGCELSLGRNVEHPQSRLALTAAAVWGGCVGCAKPFL